MKPTKSLVFCLLTWSLALFVNPRGDAANFDPPGDLMSVSPTTGLNSSGPLGGPFAAMQQSFTITNNGGSTVNWTATKDRTWVDLSATGGTLAPGAQTTVTATINSLATTLAPGPQLTIVSIKNAAVAQAHTRDVLLTIGSPQAMSFSLNTNPGWTTTGEWAFGTPTGGGGLSYGFADPTAGNTGTNVFGVNLSGDYALAVGGPFHLTTTAINMSTLRATRLRFRRWLNTDKRPFAAATVEVSNNGTAWTQVFDNGTGAAINDNAWQLVEYDISAVADAQATVFVRWSYAVLRADAFPMSGWNIDDVEILGYVPNTVTVALPATTSEAAGTVNGTVSVSPTPTSNLTVSLFSSDTSELTVPANVIVLANQSSANFTATIVNDPLLDGTQNATVTGATPGSNNTTATIAVQDNETTTLTVSIPANVAEGNTSVNGTVTLGAAAAKPVAVAVSSSDTTEIVVPATVTIPAGQMAATFVVSVVNDTLLDGAQPATVTAQVANWTTGNATTTVADNEPRTIALSVIGASTEGATGNGTVTLSGVAVTPVTVTLATNNSSAVQIPPNVTVLAGNQSATFSVTVLNDELIQPVRSVTITGSAATFSNGSTTFTIGENDADHFDVSTPSDPQLVGQGFNVTITARDAANLVVSSFNGAVGLGANGDGGLLPVTLAAPPAFSNGVATVNVAVGGAGSNVTLRVRDTAGHTGQSGVFSVRSPARFFTEQFTGAGDPNDTAGQTFTFTPDGSAEFYSVTRQAATVFPTDPAGGTALTLSDNASVAVALTGGATVAIYGTTSTSVQVGSNGYVTFAPDNTATESLTAHFAQRRVAALFDDLNPALGGSVSHRQLADRFAVTWQNIAKAGGGPGNSMQIELFFDGRITITPLAITSNEGIIGLSNGAGIPTTFVESNFTNFPTSALSYSTVAAITVPEDGTSGPVPFQINTPGVAPGTVVVTATSSDTTLIPNANLVLTGGGSRRALEVLPAANRSGGANVTLSMTVAGNTVTQVIPVTVVAVNDAPAFTKGANETALEDSGLHTVAGWATALTKGPADEAAQTLSFLTITDAPALFTVPPAISPSGTLTYTLAPNVVGVANVTAVLTDNGGVDGGGVNAAAAQSFTIAVVDVNDAPSFTKGADQTINEDGAAVTVTAWATALVRGPVSENGQTLSFLVTNNNNALFASQPAISPTGVLSFTAATNAFGTATVTVRLMDNGGTANAGADTSAPQNFTITVNAVNDVPSFTKGPSQTALEDAGPRSIPGWATNISAGAGESAQAVDFIVTNNNSALFSAQPAVAPDGTLSYTTALHANGTATVTIRIHDNSGAANNTSGAQTFTITATAVNDPPTFTKGADENALEDSGVHSVAGWATALNEGGIGETAQTLNFLVTNNNTSLFSAQPNISANGTLTYTPAANASGSATVSVSLRDSGGTSNGGVNTSAAQTFAINVLAVNDAPNFNKGADQTVLEDSAARTVTNWATAISAGSGESGQTLTFQVSAANPALFAVQPAISPAGVLTFTPAPNANGSTSVSVALMDDGGTGSGGANTSATLSFNINITAVNDVPSFSKGADQTVLEDAGAQSVPGWATDQDAGQANESAQTFSYVVSSNNSALFSAQPAVAPDGTLTFTPAANAFGTATVTVQIKDSGGTTNGGVDTSAGQAFTIDVTGVNDAPSFTKGADQTVAEGSSARTVNGWATQISRGPGESAQAGTFVVVADRTDLFSAQPAVSPTGVLTFTPAAGLNGVSNVSIKLTDNGGTANSGVNESATQSFTITITAANNAPSFTKGPNQTVLEDAGAQTVAGWATNISPGPSDESGQTVTFAASNNNNALFSAQPAVAPDGTLTFTPAADANGSATVTLTLSDDGGGTDTSAAQTFTINVTAVNDPPSFVAGPDRTVGLASGPHRTRNWATMISPGPANESAQTVDFILVADQPALFTAQPAVAPDGTLTFTPAGGAGGHAVVTITARDSGGTGNGGDDDSAPQTFAIDILGLTQLSGRYDGLAQPAAGITPGHNSVGLFGVKGTATGNFTGKLAVAGNAFTFAGAYDPNGIARFGRNRVAELELRRTGRPSYFLGFQLRSGVGGDRVEGTLREGDTLLCTIDAQRAAFHPLNNPAPISIVDPATNKGRYTAVFNALAAPNGGFDTDEFPQGDGFGLVTVSTGGIVTIKGRLADGSKVSFSTSLSTNFVWPFYVRTDGGRGSCSGVATFRDVAGQSDFDALGLRWFKPAALSLVPAKPYPQGWLSGIATDLLGSKYVVTAGVSVLPGLDGAGKATADFTAGGISVPLSKAVQVSATNAVTVTTPGADALRLQIVTATGAIRGSFMDTFGGALRRAVPQGVIFQKQSMGAGYFLGPAESGAFTLTPMP